MDKNKTKLLLLEEILLEDLFPLQDQSSTDWFEKSKCTQTFIIYKKWWLCLRYLLNFLASAKIYTQHSLVMVIISSKGVRDRGILFGGCDPYCPVPPAVSPPLYLDPLPEGFLS